VEGTGYKVEDVFGSGPAMPMSISESTNADAGAPPEAKTFSTKQLKKKAPAARPKLIERNEIVGGLVGNLAEKLPLNQAVAAAYKIVDKKKIRPEVLAQIKDAKKKKTSVRDRLRNDRYTKQGRDPIAVRPVVKNTVPKYHPLPTITNIDDKRRMDEIDALIAEARTKHLPGELDKAIEDLLLEKNAILQKYSPPPQKLSRKLAADWKESDHPRADDGKFGGGGGSGSKNNSDGKNQETKDIHDKHRQIAKMSGLHKHEVEQLAYGEPPASWKMEGAGKDGALKFSDAKNGEWDVKADREKNIVTVQKYGFSDKHEIPLQERHQHNAQVESGLKGTEGDLRKMSGIDAVEHMHSHGENGEIMHTAKGDFASVHIPEETMQQLKNHGNAVVTHNHPSGGAFSDSDIDIAVKANLKQIRAVGADNPDKPSHTYTLTRPIDGWPSKSASNEAMASAGAQARKYLAGAIENGNITPDQANDHHQHVKLMMFADMIGARYERSRNL